MIKGFKDFLLRGNVIDLAVAVVIGAAFTTIVTAFTDGIVKPLVNAVSPPTSQGLGVQLVEGKETAYLDFSVVISAAINFLIVAFVVFMLVRTINRIKELAEKPVAEGGSPVPPPADIQLLTEIRDLLKK